MSAVANSPRRNHIMGLQEYLLLALVILLPLVIAVAVTLWTLEQARFRNKKNRKRPAKMASESGHVASPAPPGNEFSGSSTEVG
jgi:hypothetical protein